MPTLVHPTYPVKVSRLAHIDVALTVVRKADGTWVDVDNFKADHPDFVGAQAVYLGGRVYDLSAGEATALTTAGYTVI